MWVERDRVPGWILDIIQPICPAGGTSRPSHHCLNKNSGNVSYAARERERLVPPAPSLDQQLSLSMSLTGQEDRKESFAARLLARLTIQS